MLIFRVLHGREFLYLVVCDLGIFQVRLDVLDLENLKIYKFSVCAYIWLRFSRFSSFLQSSGLKCNNLSMLLWYKDSWSNLFFFSV